MEDKIIRFLTGGKPTTLTEIRKRFRLSPRRVDFLLKRMQSRGIVQLEPLPDRIYVRLVALMAEEEKVKSLRRQRRGRKPAGETPPRPALEWESPNELMYR